MRLGASLFLIAIGAILKFAVATQQSHGFNIGVIGIILMVVGAVGLVAELCYQAISRRSTHVIEHTDAPIAGPYRQPRDSRY